MENIKLKPLIPWPGGKRKIIKTIVPLIPTYNTYFEPFIGAGAIFLAHKPKKAVISDINPDIINMWIQIKYFPEKLISSLTSHKISKEYWNKINKKFPTLKQGTVERCSAFCYLIRYGFASLFKLNNDGTFKNTFTTKETKSIPFKQQIENIKNISEYLNSNKIKIIHKGYIHVVKNARSKDFIYLDPPYVSLAKKTPLMYETDFDHNKLCEIYKSLSNRGVKCMMSNINSAIITKPLKLYNIKRIILNTSWSLNEKEYKHKNNRRTEILIINYVIKN